jgi:4-amino-4-deoxy-L-arabinose transferase-like glycosyltransferase
LLEKGKYESPDFPGIDLFRAPGYPTFLAFVFWLTGDSLAAVVFIQYTLGLFCAYLIYLLGKETIDQRVGVVAAILFLLSPNVLFWSASIMTEIIFTVCLMLSFLMVLRAAKDQFPLWPIGLLFGVMTLVRPIGLYLFIIWGVWFLWSFRNTDWLSVGRKFAGLVFAFTVVVIPWFVRNYRTHGEFKLSIVSEVTVDTYHLALSLVEAKDITWEEAKTEVNMLDAEGSALLSILKSYPGDFLKVQLRGIARTVTGIEVGTWMNLISTKSYQGSGILEGLISFNLSKISSAIRSILSSGDPTALLLIAWGLLHTIILIIFGAIGVIRLLFYLELEQKYLGILMVVTILYLVVVPGAAGEARFRIPAEPLLAYLSAIPFKFKNE